MLFRYHTGSLQESLKSTFEVSTLEELRNAIEKSYSISIESEVKLIGELEFSEPIYDSRTGWNTHTVSGNIEHYGKHVIGQSNGKF
jgi:hypothetical protein